MVQRDREALFVRQKELLDGFLKNGAITRRQYEKSCGDLARKMLGTAGEGSWFLLERPLSPKQREAFGREWDLPGWKIRPEDGSVCFRDPENGERIWLLTPGDGGEHVVLAWRSAGSEELDRLLLDAVLSMIFAGTGCPEEER